MLFNSFSYLWFLPTVVLVYYMLPSRYRWALLLIASYYFYMCWKVEYSILILASTMIDYWSAIGIHRSEKLSLRRIFLGLSIGTNLSLLFFFKYFNFVGENVQSAFDYFNLFYHVPVFHFLLPVGISFYTFQTMSYTIEVYRRKIEPERHFGYMAVYVSFFPQLVAGPIERPGRLLPQLRERHRFDPDRAMSGIQLIVWGLFKKMFIADGLAIYVQAVYDDPSGNAGFPLIIGTVFFAYQIYCDFSGYSDIAIGSARLLGIDLMKNFDTPYYSRSIKEFWGRWHISLSTWFRDYVYIPLGGSRVNESRLYFNLMITFVISGLWHGANWTFLIWGGIHGGVMVFSHMAAPYRGTIVQQLRLDSMPRIRRTIQVVSTFGIVCFSWVFFRAESLSHAFAVLREMLNFNLARTGIDAATGPFYFIISIAGIVLLESIQLLMRNKSVSEIYRNAPGVVRWGTIYAAVLLIILFGSYSSPGQFIYFQF